MNDESNESWQWSRLRPWMMVLADQALPDFMRHRVDSSDIVQQAMTEAWDNRENFRGTTTAQRMAWLKTILKRSVTRQQERLLDTQKRDMRREFDCDLSLDNASQRFERFAVDTATHPDAAAEKAEQIVQVASVLDGLPPDYRQVLMLRHFEDLQHDAIAVRMDRSTAAVRMLWIRALKALKQKLEQTT